MGSKKIIEDVLRSHPGVHEAAVVRDENGDFAAFVLAKDDYLNDMPGCEAAELNAVGKWRKAYDLSQRTRQAKEAAVGFNTIGWISSYTRQPIPEEEMREWVDTTVADILRFRPKNVYEIGCGTGLLLLRIAAECESYIAGDFAPAVLDRLNEQLRTMPLLSGRVRVEERTADDFSGIAEDSVDTAILSSVVQYFPSLSYLTRVLERAVHRVRAGGRVYVGDVRSLPLFQVFSSSVELFRARDEMALSDLRSLIQRRMNREQELLVSPAYFLQLERQIARIAAVEVRPLRGHAVNEMSGYRFQAILHVGVEKTVLPETDFEDWSERKWSRANIRKELQAHPDAVLGIGAIHNARVERDVLAAHLLDALDPSTSVADLRRRVAMSPTTGVDPQELFDLESEGLGFRTFLSWSACRDDGSYDACFVPNGLVTRDKPVSISWPRGAACEFVNLANWPGAKTRRNELIAQLREYGLTNLPPELSLATITLVDELPRESDGNYDVNALLSARNTSRSL